MADIAINIIWNFVRSDDGIRKVVLVSFDKEPFDMLFKAIQNIED